MAVLVPVVLVVVGLAALTVGGDWLVRGAVALAKRLGVTPTVIGLTIVAAGTSFPELVVSLLAAFQGHPAVAVGNILGSNVFNIFLIAGLVAVLANPLAGSPVIARRDTPVLLAGTVLFGLVAMDLHLGRLDGVLLSVTFAGYIAWLVIRPDKPCTAVDEELLASPTWLLPVGLVVVPAGAHALVVGAVDLALMAGLSERFVAMTIVSWGTSLPEVAASLAAIRAGHAGLSLGNVVGSNLFNTLAIGGATALACPIPVAPSALRYDFPLVCAATVLLAVLHRGGRDLSRRAGMLLLSGFVALFVLLAL